MNDIPEEKARVPPDHPQAGSLAEADVQCVALEDDGIIPNSRLPLLVYAGAIRFPGRDAASTVESIFNVNQWRAAWRYGVFSYHHYHSTAHETLGSIAGPPRSSSGATAASRSKCTRETSSSFQPVSPTRILVPAQISTSLAPIRLAGTATCGTPSRATAPRWTRILPASHYRMRTPCTAPPGRSCAGGHRHSSRTSAKAFAQAAIRLTGLDLARARRQDEA